MTTASNILIQGAMLTNAANALAYIAPVQSGLAWFGFLNSSFLSAGTIRNLANPGAPAATPIGAPTVGPSFTTFHGAADSPVDAFNTGLFDSVQDATWYGLVQANDTFASGTTNPLIWSNFGTDTGNPITGAKGLNLSVNSAGSGGFPAAAWQLHDNGNNAGSAVTANSGTVNVPGAVLTCYIVGTTMTVSAIVGSLSNGVTVNQALLSSGGVAAGTTIISQLTGSSGGVGNYQVSISQTLGSSGSQVTVNAALWKFIMGTTANASGVRAIYDLSDGTTTSGTHQSPRAPNLLNTFLIGAQPASGGNTGICNIAHAGYHQGYAATQADGLKIKAAVLAYTSGLASPITGF